MHEVATGNMNLKMSAAMFRLMYTTDAVNSWRFRIQIVFSVRAHE